jgi:hypothetical protein
VIGLQRPSLFRYSTLCGSMHTLVQFRSADESLSRDLLEDDTS